MNIKILALHSHEQGSDLASTVVFDDLDSGRRMVAGVSEEAFFEPAAHPICEGFDADLAPQGKLHIEKYDTEALVRLIKKTISTEVNTPPDSDDV